MNLLFHRQIANHYWPLDSWLACRFLPMALLLFATGCGSSQPEETTRSLVVYTSQDRVYAEPIFNQFTKATGIEIKAQFDSESAKTMGLAKRILAEQTHPVCDLFWSNESLAVRKLAEAGAVQGFEELGYRMRVLILNTNLVSSENAPASLKDLTLPKWNGKAVMAYPLYGTTATHMLALREEWGADVWEPWCQRMIENEVKIVDGNSMVVRLVGAGEAAVGLTDSDDLAVGLSKGLPLTSIPLKNDLCAIPNTVGMVTGAPHPTEAMAFLTFIKANNVLSDMVNASALVSAEPPPHDDQFLHIYWAEIMAEEKETFHWMRETFIR